MFENDVLFSKVSIIRNCCRTITCTLEQTETHLEQYLLDDIIAVNLQRAVQATIDAAHVIISQQNLKLPATYKESFVILQNRGVIESSLADTMKKLVGFRNVSVHEYQAVSHEVMRSIVQHHLVDFERFCIAILKNIANNN